MNELQVPIDALEKLNVNSIRNIESILRRCANEGRDIAISKV